jgi:hypothetical protein
MHSRVAKYTKKQKKKKDQMGMILEKKKKKKKKEKWSICGYNSGVLERFKNNNNENYNIVN